jgi:hypothetical protein
MKELSVLEHQQLVEYANLDGSELGEACSILIQMWDYRDYISNEFKEALEKELKTQVKNFKDNCKIVTKKVKLTQVVKELEWK